jgi:ferric-dicitrate binding protein FerR (iron transport regulator)
LTLAQKPTIDEILLDRFFADQCTDDEREAVLTWMADPENESHVRKAMEHHWSDMQQIRLRAGVDVEQLLAKTKEKIFDTSSGSSTSGEKPPPKNPKSFSLRLAAIWIGLLLAFSGLIFLTDYFESSTSFSVDEKEKITPTHGIEEVKSSSGQIVEKILPDGTKVVLNAQSSLRFPTAFSGHATREVILTGEAFFDVTEDKDHAFIVKTQGINIVVLGTAFNLKSYEGDPTIETTLIRGKVIIENNRGISRKKVELKPNQKAVFSIDTENITLINVRQGETAPWTKASLEFEQEELFNVIKSLERWYGVIIHMQDNTDMSCRLTARIDKESLNETMEVLKSLTGIRYSIVEKEVFIEGKICEK